MYTFITVNVENWKLTKKLLQSTAWLYGNLKLEHSTLGCIMTAPTSHRNEILSKTSKARQLYGSCELQRIQSKSKRVTRNLKGLANPTRDQ